MTWQESWLNNYERAGQQDLRKAIEEAINKASAENGSDAPDFVLAQFLIDSLAAYDRATNARTRWYDGATEFPRA